MRMMMGLGWFRPAQAQVRVRVEWGALVVFERTSGWCHW
jgi:hypothetical protein